MGKRSAIKLRRGPADGPASYWRQGNPAVHPERMGHSHQRISRRAACGTAHDQAKERKRCRAGLALRPGHEGEARPRHIRRGNREGLFRQADTGRAGTGAASERRRQHIGGTRDRLAHLPVFGRK